MDKRNMSRDPKHLSLRIDEELLYKFRHVARYHDRSANGQLLCMVRDVVRKYEKEVEVIPFPPEKE